MDFYNKLSHTNILSPCNFWHLHLFAHFKPVISSVQSGHLDWPTTFPPACFTPQPQQIAIFLIGVRMLWLSIGYSQNYTFVSHLHMLFHYLCDIVLPSSTIGTLGKC